MSDKSPLSHDLLRRHDSSPVVGAFLLLTVVGAASPKGEVV